MSTNETNFSDLKQNLSRKVTFTEFNSKPTFKGLKKKDFIKDLRNNVKFLIVKTNVDKLSLMRLTLYLPDASSFCFWLDKNNSDTQGLTIKAFPKKPKETNFTNTYLKNGNFYSWKCIWFNGDGKLRIANNSISLGKSIFDEQYKEICDIKDRLNNNESYNNSI